MSNKRGFIGVFQHCSSHVCYASGANQGWMCAQENTIPYKRDYLISSHAISRCNYFSIEKNKTKQTPTHPL